MTRLLAVLDQARNSPRTNPAPTSPCGNEDDLWLVAFADAVTRVPDSLGLRYLDLLIRQPGRDLAALDLVRARGRGRPPRQQKTGCTTRPEPGPTRSST